MIQLQIIPSTVATTLRFQFSKEKHKLPNNGEKYCYIVMNVLFGYFGNITAALICVSRSRSLALLASSAVVNTLQEYQHSSLVLTETTNTHINNVKTQAAKLQNTR